LEGRDGVSGYERIKRLAKELGCTIPELLVLARQNDPFFVGSKTDLAMAEWFADLWLRFGYTTGVHLRRVHYQLVSQEAATKHNGKPYENTESCWASLCNAGKYARSLGLVDAAAFVDRRNPSPRMYMNPEPGDLPYWTYDFPEWSMPWIRTELGVDIDWEIPTLAAEGYEYRDVLQPYHVEVWCEKSTMNDELVPLCRRYVTNLVTGVGFMSITSVVNLLRRVRELEKPCRILYVSDFDPAGDVMPVSVARQIEYWAESYAPGSDIKLEPVVLTARQVEQYRLPRIPIKDEDRRKANFEAVYGTGAVELDALEALHPGEFARILASYIRPLRDAGVASAVGAAEEEAIDRLEAAHEAALGPYREELEELKREVGAVVDRYRGRLEDLSVSMDSELEPYRQRLESLRIAIQEDVDTLEVELPALPISEPYQEHDGWLFDSTRPYFEQLGFYKDRTANEEGAS
jgi:hypothetical protein